MNEYIYLAADGEERCASSVHEKYLILIPRDVIIDPKHQIPSLGVENGESVAVWQQRLLPHC